MDATSKCDTPSIFQHLFKVLKTFSDGEYFPISSFIFNSFLCLLFLNITTVLILTFRCHLFRNRLVIFNISYNSFADLANKAISSINNKHMIIMKPYWTPRSPILSSTFSSSISSPIFSPESGILVWYYLLLLLCL